MAATLLLSYLYFLQGLPYGLQARFLPIYFRAHGMSLTNIGFIKVLFFPWMCKTLWAPFVDRHGNKKLWLSWSMLGLGITCIFAAGIQPDWLFLLCVVLLAFNFLTSTQDIATDGLAIEILTSTQVASGNIAQVVGYKFGAIIGGGVLAWLNDYITWSSIFIFLTLIYASAMVMVKVFVPESKIVEKTLDVPAPTDADQFRNSTQGGDRSGKENEWDDREKFKSPSMNTRSKTKDTNTLPHCSADLKTSLKSNDSKHSAYDVRSENKDGDFQHADFNNSSATEDGAGEGVGWFRDHFAVVLRADGTTWILTYVLVYKLGEQGALNMMPMFLMDGGVSTSGVGMWTGVVGLVVSIAGSVLGGAAISSGRCTAMGFLQLLSVVKVGVLALETLVVTALSLQSRSLTVASTAPCVTLMLLLLLVSGAVSTAAFTLMMQCSQRADAHCRASHYSLLATAEVLGKLVFSIFVGALTDFLGYSLAFGLFLSLSLIVLPLFWYAPKSLVGVSCSEGGERGKNC
ncbi:hypothetical protein ACOMHN_016171 [Nucella lapillus]